MAKEERARGRKQEEGEHKRRVGRRVQRARRRPGTGCVSQLKEHLWEGRYSPVWPDGKKHSRNVYAKTKEECEEKLKGLILKMKAEIAALRSGTNGVSLRGKP